MKKLYLSYFLLGTLGAFGVFIFNTQLSIFYIILVSLLPKSSLSGLLLILTTMIVMPYLSALISMVIMQRILKMFFPKLVTLKESFFLLAIASLVGFYLLTSGYPQRLLYSLLN